VAKGNGGGYAERKLLRYSRDEINFSPVARVAFNPEDERGRITGEGK